jgi:regulator of RNase E activity RraA
VHVHRGDLVVADRDGIAVVPSARLSEVAELVDAKRALEQSARDDLLAGMGIHAVWDKYQVF